MFELLGLKKILLKLIVGGIIVVAVFSLANTVSDKVMSFFGVETKEQIKTKLIKAQNDIIVLEGINKSNRDEMVKLKISQSITEHSFNTLLENKNKILLTKEKVVNKIHVYNKDDKPTDRYRKQIEGVWEMYCSFNKDMECVK